MIGRKLLGLVGLGLFICGGLNPAYAVIEDRIDFDVQPELLVGGEYQLSTKILIGDELDSKNLPSLDDAPDQSGEDVYVVAKFALVADTPVTTFSFRNLVDTDFIQSLQAMGTLRGTDVDHVKKMVFDLSLGPVTLSSEKSTIYIDAYNFETSEALVAIDANKAQKIADIDEALGSPNMLAYSSVFPDDASNTLSKSSVITSYYETTDGQTMVVSYFVAKVSLGINKTVLKFSKGVIERALRGPFKNMIESYQSI